MSVAKEPKYAPELPLRPSLSTLRVALVGAGHLAEALVRGWTQAGMPPENVAVTNRSRHERLLHLREAYGVRTYPDKARALAGAHVVVLAVRPPDVTQCLRECRPYWPQGAVLVSPVAGVPVERLRRELGVEAPVVRAMPNTSSAVGQSATALYAPGVGPTHLLAVERLWDCVGDVVHVERESHMDAATGLAGSGPAYVYLLVEALTEAGVQEGLSPEVSRRLAVQTVYGAALHLYASREDPAHLRQRVTSPGGTTAAGLAALEQRGFRPALREAVARAAQRSRELGRLSG